MSLLSLVSLNILHFNFPFINSSLINTLNAICVAGFRKGDPSILVYPVDSLGQKCGQDEPVKDKRYLFFFDITECAKANVLIYGCRTPQVRKIAQNMV